MTLGVITNVSSLTAQNSLSRAEKDLGVAMERLSTGSKINSASDDAAGLAIAQRLEAQARGLDMAAKCYRRSGANRCRRFCYGGGRRYTAKNARVSRSSCKRNEQRN